MKKLFCIILCAFFCVPLCARHEYTHASSAASMIVIESSTNRVLYQQRAFDRRFMASTTKILTAITVLENVDDITSMVKVHKNAAGVEGSSIYLSQNEKISIENLLYGLMLQSGNDCAAALAYAVGGSISGFAELMNKTAKKAGAHNSNFVNPHGLHDDNHYTTAYDLAMISSYAMKNADFAKIVSTKTRKMDWAGRDYPRVVNNKNKILSTLEGGDGIKTGFTKRAGRCLVASATRNGMQVIAVVLNCGPMFEECRALINQAFHEFTYTEVLPAQKILGSVSVSGSPKERVEVFSPKSLYYPLRAHEQKDIKLLFESKNLSAPVSKYQEAGKITVFFCGKQVASQSVYTTEAAESFTLSDNLKKLLEN